MSDLTTNAQTEIMSNQDFTEVTPDLLVLALKDLANSVIKRTSFTADEVGQWIQQNFPDLARKDGKFASEIEMKLKAAEAAFIIKSAFKKNRGQVVEAYYVTDKAQFESMYTSPQVRYLEQIVKKE